MTTIAYNHKDQQIAVDSRYTVGNVITTDKADKVRINSRGIWFFAGVTAHYNDLMSLAHNDKCNARPDCVAIVVNDDGVFVTDTDENGVCFWQLLNVSRCIGSGENFALAAMDFGKSAKEAVKYAATRDIYTGGRIRVYDIKTKKWI